MCSKNKTTKATKKPHWLKRKLPTGAEYENIRALMKKSSLHTVCQEAMCPNIWECFSQKTATFLIMGPNCTRNCGFCAVESGRIFPLDSEEPERVSAASKQMGLTYVVVTSVTRDDLPDGGAAHFGKTITAIRKQIPDVRIEVLIPDFQGKTESLKKVINAGPDIINHNIETCPRLYKIARKEASYNRSLNLLKKSKELAPSIPTKSGIMLGLGETEEEVLHVFEDLIAVGCSILTIGQYLQPSKKHLPVEDYVTPEQFNGFRETALKMGFQDVSSGPLVRSSYQAHKFFKK